MQNNEQPAELDQQTVQIMPNVEIDEARAFQIAGTFDKDKATATVQRGLAVLTCVVFDLGGTLPLAAEHFTEYGRICGLTARGFAVLVGVARDLEWVTTTDVTFDNPHEKHKNMPEGVKSRLFKKGSRASGKAPKGKKGVVIHLTAKGAGKARDYKAIAEATAKARDAREA